MKFLKLPLLLLLLILSCSDKSKVSGSEGTASETVGILYKSDLALAPNATILIVEDNATALPESPVNMDTTYTDSNGQFDLSSLNDGIYNIFGELNGTKSFLKSVVINNTDDISDTVKDTLGATANVAGIVKHEYHNDSRYIIGLMPGTGKFFIPNDSAGEFIIEDLAAGVYDIRLISLLQGYLPKDTTFIVNPLVIDSTLDTIIVEFGDIAPVSGLGATYDSLMQIVSLSWNKADSVEAYNVYRTLKGENQELITSTPVVDTFYNDSTVDVNSEYTYTVAGVKTGVSGTQSAGIVVNTVSLYDSVKTIGGFGSGDGQFDMIGGMAVYRDSLLYICDAMNQRIQVYNDSINFLKNISIDGAPVDIDIINDSILVILDLLNAIVKTYSIDGTELDTIIALNNFNYAKLESNNDKNIYICNPAEALIINCSINGTMIDTITDSTYIKSPTDVAVDNNNTLFIIDGTSNVLILKDSVNANLEINQNIFNTPMTLFHDKISNSIILGENQSGNIYILENEKLTKKLNVNTTYIKAIAKIKNLYAIAGENNVTVIRE